MLSLIATCAKSLNRSGDVVFYLFSLFILSVSQLVEELLKKELMENQEGKRLC